MIESQEDLQRLTRKKVGHCAFANFDGPPKYKKDPGTQMKENIMACELFESLAAIP
jgi:hypothetical protein